MPFYYYGFDWTYLYIVLPCLLLAMIASVSVNSTFKRYSKHLPRSHRPSPAEVFVALRSHKEFSKEQRPCFSWRDCVLGRQGITCLRSHEP